MWQRLLQPGKPQAYAVSVKFKTSCTEAGMAGLRARVTSLQGCHGRFLGLHESAFLQLH